MNASTIFRTGLLALVSLFLLASVVFAGDYKNGGTLVNKSGKSFNVTNGSFINYTTSAGTVNNAGTINVNTAGARLFVNSNGAGLNGTLTNNIVAANGTVNVGVDFQNVTGTVTNPGTISVTQDFTNTTGSVTNSGTIDANRDVTSTTGTFGNTGTIKVFRNLTATSGLTTSAGTVEYDGTGAQSVLGVAYDGLKALTGNTKTLAGNASVATTFEITGATLDVADKQFTISTTTLTAGALGVLDADAGTVIYDRAGDQVVFPGATHLNLTLSGSGVKTSSGALTLNGVFTSGASNTLFVTGAAFTSDAAATLTANSGTIKVDASPTIGGAYKAIGGTFEYAGTSTAKSAQYTNLTVSAGTVTFTDGVEYRLKGSYSASGSTRVFGTSTINFNGDTGQDQSIASAETFGGLKFELAGVKTISAAIGASTVLIASSVNAGDGVYVNATGTLTVSTELENNGTLTNDGTITVN